MKNMFKILVSAFLLAACSKPAIVENDGPLKSFSVYCDNVKYTGVIDNDNKEVRIGGIRYTSAITAVDVKLGDKYAFASEEPQSFIGKWEKVMTFSISSPNKEISDWKIIMNDFLSLKKEDYKVVAYVPGQGDWPYDDAMKKKLRWEQLTHVNLHFIVVNEDGTINTDQVATNIGWIANEAKKYDVKVLASVVSGANNSFASAISTPEGRTRLCKALWGFVGTYGIDGLDIDYENWINFDELNLFTEELGKLRGDRLLTCAVNAQEIAKDIYRIGWHNSFDFINIMAYDFGEWKDGIKQPGQHSSYEDAEKSVKMWINELNTPAEKLVLGVPFYGYSHDESLKDLFTWENEISYENLVKHDPKAADVDQYGPSTFYNGRPTIMKKCQMVVDNELGGIMIWNLKYDTENEEYSLLNVISNSLKKSTY